MFIVIQVIKRVVKRCLCNRKDEGSHYHLTTEEMSLWLARLFCYNDVVLVTVGLPALLYKVSSIDSHYNSVCI